MIQEAYVSFETAKLLKEKGFNIPYDSFRGVYINGEFKRLNPGDGFGYNFGDEIVEVCSLQMAMRWLREVHNIVICAEIGNENDKGNTDYTNPDRWHWFFDLTNEKGVVIEPESDYILNEFDSYEDAVEAAIKYCLTNLI